MTDSRKRPQIILPRRIDLPIQRMDSRLAHEHDQNDALRARLSWYQEFSEFLKGKEDHVVAKVEKKIIEGTQKKSANLFNFFVWANIYAVFLITVLKLAKVI